MPRTKQMNRPKASEITGILPDWAIKELVKKKIIKVNPLSADWETSKFLGPCSLDFRLGGKLLFFKESAYRFINTQKGLGKNEMEEYILEDGEPFSLEPGVFVIASTLECLELPNDILGRLEGKSGLARLGIAVHSTAGRFDPGWKGNPALEFSNLGPRPVFLFKGMRICAFSSASN